MTNKNRLLAMVGTALLIPLGIVACSTQTKPDTASTKTETSQSEIWSSVPSSAPNGVTAKQVVDAVVAAGLPATDPRDNTSQMCQALGCSGLITTDDLSVYEFPDTASADKWAAAFPLGYVKGTIFLRYNEGDHPTDPANIPKYNAILDGLMAGR
jgi:hypothetical protein